MNIANTIGPHLIGNRFTLHGHPRVYTMGPQGNIIRKSPRPWRGKSERRRVQKMLRNWGGTNV